MYLVVRLQFPETVGGCICGTFLCKISLVGVELLVKLFETNCFWEISNRWVNLKILTDPSIDPRTRFLATGKLTANPFNSNIFLRTTGTTQKICCSSQKQYSNELKKNYWNFKISAWKHARTAWCGRERWSRFFWAVVYFSPTTLTPVVIKRITHFLRHVLVNQG